MPSLRLETLVQQLGVLRAHLLPDVFDPTGVYSDEWISRARAYRVLAHAEVEAYLEDRSREVAKSALDRWKRDRVASPCLLGLVAFSGQVMEGAPESVAPPQPSAAKVHSEKLSLHARVKRASTAYYGVLERNHGIREANALQLLLPLGIDIDALDAAWLATVDSFGMRRGEAAHSSAASLTLKHPPDPKTEFDTVQQIVDGLKVLDEILDWSGGVPSISVDGLEQALLSHLLEHIPDELDQLSTHTMIDDVVDLDVDEISVRPGAIKVNGSGVIEVTLQYGGGGEMDGTGDSYPFTFEAELGPELEVHAAVVEVDTTSFYE